MKLMSLLMVAGITFGLSFITEAADNQIFQGRVVSVEKLAASACCGGRLAWRAEFGDMVRQGQPLFRLEDGELKMKKEACHRRVEKLQSRLVQIQKRHERMKVLGQNQHAGVAEVEDACFETEKTRLELAEEQAELARYEYLMVERVFYAPYDGVVIDTLLNPGEYMTSGKEVLRFEGLKREVDVWLPRAFIHNTDQLKCSVVPESNRLGVTLKNPRHGLSADPATGLFKVRFQPGAALRFSGEAVTVQCRIADTEAKVE